VRSSNHALISTDFLEEVEEDGGAVPYLKSQVTQPINNSDYGRMDCNAMTLICRHKRFGEKRYLHL